MSIETKVKEYLLENANTLKQVVSELNSWNGCLESLEVHEFDESFFEIMFTDPMEAVRAWHFGSDNNSWNDEYIRFNSYGNLETLSEYTYEEELKESIDEIVDYLIQYQSQIYLDNELKYLLSEDEQDEDEA